MRTTDSKPGRSVNPLDTERPIGLFSSLKMELSVLITISTIIAFIMAWFLLKVGLSLWIAMPITLAVALGITYFFSRGLTSPLREMRDAAEAMADGDYTVRVHVDANSRDEVGQLALSFNEMAEELQGRGSEKKRRVLRGNTMSCRHRSMVGSMANPPHPSPDCNPEEDIYSEADSDAADHSYLPPRCLLYLGMMMLVISCICCLAVPTFDIIYVICLV